MKVRHPDDAAETELPVVYRARQGVLEAPAHAVMQVDEFQTTLRPVDMVGELHVDHIKSVAAAHGENVLQQRDAAFRRLCGGPVRADDLARLVDVEPWRGESGGEPELAQQQLDARGLSLGEGAGRLQVARHRAEVALADEKARGIAPSRDRGELVETAVDDGIGRQDAVRRPGSAQRGLHQRVERELVQGAMGGQQPVRLGVQRGSLALLPADTLDVEDDRTLGVAAGVTACDRGRASMAAEPDAGGGATRMAGDRRVHIRLRGLAQRHHGEIVEQPPVDGVPVGDAVS